MNAKTHLLAKLGQQTRVARSFVSEVKVKSFVNFTGMQLLFEDALGKFLGREK